MEKLIVIETKDTPGIVFDTENNFYRITGPSFPENAVVFYTRVIEWLEKAKDVLRCEMKIELFYTYINSASKKRVYDILIRLESLYMRNDKVRVVWYYDKFDEDMYDLGQEFAEMVNVPFQFVEGEPAPLTPAEA